MGLLVAPMDTLVARIPMDTISAFLMLRVFVVKAALAPMEIFVAKLLMEAMVAVLFPMVFVVKLAVVPMEPDVMTNMGPVSCHNFCLC